MLRLAPRASLFIAASLATATFLAGPSGCTQPARPVATNAEEERSGSGATAREVVQSHGLLQLIFSLTASAPVSTHRPPWLGCQLHLLDARGSLRVAADLGDARRREFFPRAASYTRRPAIFPFGAPTERLQVELHTTLAPPVVYRAPGRWGRSGRHIRLPAPLPERWAFSCVLRREDGDGSAIDGLFTGRRPRVITSRRVTASSLAPAQMRAHLKLLLR